ncbi:VOC family protein [Chlorogloeopsis sp. ULAP02]|uniref:VOC family protein n=1 Tax=Chlorogloeopsis sp. ULAP02 TaxID=3107926 RepID=UPI00313674F0
MCYSVHDLQAFQEHLQKHQVEIILDKQLRLERKRFFLRDPAGNRIEIVQFKHK